MILLKNMINHFLSIIIPGYKRILNLERFVWGAIFCEIKEGVEIQKNSRVDQLSSIGEYTYIGFNNIITRATIGRYCSIANNCSIGMGEHSSHNISTSSLFDNSTNIFLEQTKLPIELGHDVWVGQDCIIRRGVKIGNGAIIGANSFVNKSVPDFAIVAGSPAKIIRYRFTEEKIKQINASRWWELNPAEAKKVINELEKKFPV